MIEGMCLLIGAAAAFFIVYCVSQTAKQMPPRSPCMKTTTTSKEAKDKAIDELYLAAKRACKVAIYKTIAIEDLKQKVEKAREYCE